MRSARGADPWREHYGSTLYDPTGNAGKHRGRRVPPSDGANRVSAVSAKAARVRERTCWTPPSRPRQRSDGAARLLRDCSHRGQNPPDGTCAFLRYRPDRRRKRRGLPRSFPLSTSRPVEKTRPLHGTAPGNGVRWRSQRSPASDIISAEQHGAIGIKQSSIQLLGRSSSIILCRNASCHNPPRRTGSPPSAAQQLPCTPDAGSARSPPAINRSRRPP